MADSLAAWNRPTAPWTYGSKEKSLRLATDRGWCSRPIELDGNGNAHLYVDPTNGDDTNDGLTAEHAFATINAAWLRTIEWIELGILGDMVVHLADGDHVGYVDLTLPRPPRGRIVFMGDRRTMTVVESGTVDAATPYWLQVGGASWTPDEYAGLILRVFDPNDEAGTERLMMVRENATNELSGTGTFDPTVMPGWGYEILRPAVRIVGEADDFLSAVAAHVPVRDPAYFVGDTGPGIHFAFIEFYDAVATHGAVVSLTGGTWTFVGCIITSEGPYDGLDVLYATVETGRYNYVADPVYGLGSLYSPVLVDCCLTFFGSGYSNVVMRIDSSDFAGGVCNVTQNSYTGLFAFRTGRMSIVGGCSISDSEIQFGAGTVGSIYGAGVGFDQPFLIKEGPAGGAIRVDGVMDVFASALELKALTGTAFIVTHSTGVLKLRGDVRVADAADVPGRGVYCYDGGKAGLAAAVGTGGSDTFKSTGANLRAGSVEATFASLTKTAPIYDLPADSDGDTIPAGRAASTAGGTMARIWET